MSPATHTSEENFVQLFASNERHLRAFVRSMGLDWTVVDDVVQTISLVMWRKWDTFDPATDFMRWARVIARFEVLKFRSTMARDRHVFTDDLGNWSDPIWTTAMRTLNGRVDEFAIYKTSLTVAELEQIHRQGKP
jgi:RNA polymerase sigma factor (sigma-70 family)